MKILCVFVDMIRVDRLHLYNDYIAPTIIDDFLAQIGGTLYRRCYTPAPDTPRSLACMQSGFYPHKNGCDTRIKWPAYYLKEDIKTLFDCFAEMQFDINLYAIQNRIEVGQFKFRKTDFIHTHYDCNRFLDNYSKCSENEVSFLTLLDYHHAIDDFRGTLKGCKKGQGLIYNSIVKYLNKKVLEVYDHIFIFSDHGHMFDREIYLKRSTLDYLGDSRTQILMFHHTKDDFDLNIDTELRCILDLFPTLLQITAFEDTEKRDGISLLSSIGHDFIMIEDHSDFSVKPEQIINQWRVISSKYDYRTNVKDDNSLLLKNEDKEDAINKIRKISPIFIEYYKQLQILEKYRMLRYSDRYYLTGIKRSSKWAVILRRIVIKLKYSIIIFKNV
jgi:hypothetical protein